MKNDIDLYVEQFPKATQKQLNKLRNIIKSTAPAAEEMISYKMPAYKLHGMLVYFAGYKAHVGFYPTPSGIKNFLPKLKGYKCSKAAVQFLIDQPLPESIIKEIVAFRIKENASKK
jgi:uncharacterized protein YdhG (YjbR/CyaY superfamily)